MYLPLTTRSKYKILLEYYEVINMSILTKPLHLPKLPKPVGITIRVVLIAIAVLALIWLVLFIHAMTFTTDYVNATSRRPAHDADYNAYLKENSYEINLPFFGNSVLLDGVEGGGGYVIPFYVDGGLPEYALWQIMNAYDSINFVLDSYTLMIAYKYDCRARVNYTVEKNDGLLTVRFAGEGYNEDGSLAENIDKEFVFDVKGASAFNYPEWVNRTPEDDYFANFEFQNS